MVVTLPKSVEADNVEAFSIARRKSLDVLLLTFLTRKVSQASLKAKSQIKGIPFTLPALETTSLPIFCENTSVTRSAS